ncbi:30S ribosomal protein S16 [Marinilongibacter aquaticus]|uniref:30S ribosomal protein S16 n=1 Tax=Marinilongibacter aquaticus TaxID=2975157 RepID=UPI0021BDA6E4|nr:30S ribosomal protein S16 [Marinilongibacter aquaticus]UBM59453.1 30S ribosomal protein S16 [Marinilongibacter aquaticus]
MAVKIRLSRHGRKKRAIYNIVVADSRSPRDGKFIEKLGQYNPNSTPAQIEVNDERALHWLMTGAQPTDTTRKILSVKGLMLKKHLQVGVEKGAITQDDADKKFDTWLDEKAKVREGKLAKLASDKDAAKKAVFDAERKRKEEMEAKKKEAEAALIAEAEAQEAATEEAPEAAEEASEENAGNE